MSSIEFSKSVKLKVVYVCLLSPSMWPLTVRPVLLHAPFSMWGPVSIRHNQVLLSLADQGL